MSVLLGNLVHLQNVFCLTGYHQITYIRRNFLRSPRSAEKETTKVANIEVTRVYNVMAAICVK